MSYGVNIAEVHRRSAAFVDRILKGARPADLPVEQPAKLELFVNMRTAKALGLTPPQSLLLRADRVVQCGPTSMIWTARTLTPACRQRPSATADSDRWAAEVTQRHRG